MSTYSLDNAVSLMVHLKGGVSDGYLTETDSIMYNTDGESLTELLDNITANISEITVSSSDGTITVSAGEAGTDLSVNIDNETIVSNSGVLSVADAALTQYIGSGAISVSETDTETNEKTISLVISDSDEILSQDENGLIANLTIEKVTEGLESENILEQYNIIGKDDTVIGSIPVYKDRSLIEAYLGTSEDTVDSDGVVTKVDTDNPDSLCFVYQLADGTYSLIAIDIAEYLRESEFGDGLQVTGGVVSVLIDSDSESYLSVDENGLKLSGIDDAIETAINALDVTEIGGDGYMITTISETDGVIAATIITASADNISASEIAESDNTIAVSGTTVEAQIESLAESVYSIQTQLTVDSSDSTITVSTDETGTDLSVNIDNETIVSNSGVLSVDSSALTQYIGSEAISVSETDTETNEKTISLVIDSDSESYLSQSSSGLLLTGIDSAISTAIEALDVTEIGGDGYMITTISETDGVIAATIITASADNISASEIAESDNTIAVSGTTVEAQIESLAESVYSIQTQLTVDSSDSTITVSTDETGTDLSVNIDNETIVSNSGVLSVDSSALTQYVGSNAISVSETDTETNEKTISLVISDSDEILSQDENGLIANLSIEVITDSSSLDENVLEQYNIIGKDDTVIGSIPIYKDKSLINAYLGTTDDEVNDTTGEVTAGEGDDALCFVYQLADGTYSLVAIDVADFLRESEFGDGLQVTDGVVSILIDSDSTDYLSTSEDGLSVSGISELETWAAENTISASDIEGSFDYNVFENTETYTSDPLEDE